ncbi:MAG: pyrroline-5-carboxylate reductase [Candidatus Microthrix sp.]|uniref:Pyrroline-5-carboxylate reductase n=1 Tax=Candidatus Neomicrothrix subdominans TaxID=2954438 RepID=A0A936TEZ8_9ACTN|nr:pyrroline-5-carboxylate reductase [Candidatus Microthrix sp.]MBK6440283.1 pyrroline-5-carboxylate reductase [Candidatus Microthrix sp.]MBK7163815.1 pyrroline-5-carboxylate reductase [Candidatus Microthrix sp.]MBK9297239.1 pyrroline-5-carboxylate reductase [Candidatus Microthrix subdominans]
MVESSASEVGSPPAGIRSSGIAVQFVGGGRMGEAIIAGLIRSGELRAEEIAVVEALPARREQLRVTYPQLVLGDVPTAAPTVIAVKPDDVAAAVSKAVAAGVDTVLSVAAGVPLGRLEVAAGPGVAVVRAMPNTPALVGAGVAALAPGSEADETVLVWAEGILGAVGDVVRVSEAQLDAVTGISGSGPAYVFLVAEALIEAAVAEGLPRPVAERLVVGTVRGAGMMLAESGQSAGELRAGVTSPGGTTAAGLRALEDRAVRGAFAAAVAAATERSRLLGAG